MEGFEKGLFPSKSIASPKFSSTGENNENDSSQEKMIPRFQNHKKTVSKHFMSPTLSAASKAAAPRKKILAERNENSGICDGQSHKKTNLDFKKSPRNSSISHSDRSSSRVVSSYDHALEPEDDGDANFIDDSSVKAYDPLTNYLSPRPKYLRFNPNRRREIFNRLERECREEVNSSFDFEEVNDEVESSVEEIGDSSFSPPKENVVKLNAEKTEEDNDNTTDDEEEEEELEEERGWCLKGALKLLLTLIACLLSTSYICSMNSPTYSPNQQAISNLKDGCLMIKKQTLEFISMKMHDSGLFEMEVRDNYREVEEVEIDEDKHGEIEESVEAEIVEEDVENLERHEEIVINENEDSQDKIDKAAELEGVRATESEFKDDKFEQLIAAKTDEIIDAGTFCLEKEMESFYMDLNEDKVDKTETSESESIGGEEVESETQSSAQLVGAKTETSESEGIGGGEVESETQSSAQLIGAKTEENEDAGGYGSEMEIEGSSQLQELELSAEPLSEETPKDSKVLDDTGLLEELVGMSDELIDYSHEVEEIGYNNEVEMEKPGWNSSAVIGVSVVSILSSLAIINCSKKARSTSAEESVPVLKPHKFAVQEKVAPVPPSTERKVEFFARPSLSSHAIEEAPKELNHHVHAPTVELIGEMVVGQLSSLRIHGKHQMTESQESNATFSSKHGSLAEPVSAPTRPPAIEHSTISSPSDGSFTTERKILKKEGGQRGEAMTEVTPVRRSSRLRNRAAVTSP